MFSNYETAIEDPNTGLTLWDSGAIIQYLIEQYGTERKLTYGTLKEKHLLNQWLMFQMSGQGPYYGQNGWYISPSYYLPLSQTKTRRMILFSKLRSVSVSSPLAKTHHRFNTLHPEKNPKRHRPLRRGDRAHPRSPRHAPIRHPPTEQRRRRTLRPPGSGSLGTRSPTQTQHSRRGTCSSV